MEFTCHNLHDSWDDFILRGKFLVVLLLCGPTLWGHKKINLKGPTGLKDFNDANKYILLVSNTICEGFLLEVEWIYLFSVDLGRSFVTPLL